MIRIAPQETEAAAAEDPGVCKAGVPNAVAAKDSVAPFVRFTPSGEGSGGWTASFKWRGSRLSP